MLPIFLGQTFFMFIYFQCHTYNPTPSNNSFSFVYFFGKKFTAIMLELENFKLTLVSYRHDIYEGIIP